MEKSAFLIIAGRPEDPVRMALISGRKVLGRKELRSAADILIDSKIVSGKHGVFWQEKDRFFYKDTRSLNGTYINGQKLQLFDGNGSEPVLLHNGDILRIDRKTLDKPHPEAVTMIFLTDYDRRSRWDKRILNPYSSVTIGRGADNSINLQQPYVSREHAIIYARNGNYYIKNCGSMNGIYVNNSLVGNTAELHDRNVIKIGNTYFFVLHDMLIYNAGIVSEVGLVIDIKETAVKEKIVKKKTLLADIHAEIDKGDLGLILGGSGAGKTTLINSVLGKYKIKGNIEIKGTGRKKHIGRSDNDNSIAYVPQTLPIRKDEKLIDVITDTATLRMNGKMSAHKRKQFIKETLESLGLASKSDTMIKNLSGGEQRRAAIANEAVTNPDIFFLDEPDSGLDPKSGMELMMILKELAQRGKIVMLISHNYASYPKPENIFTKIIVLAKSDRDGIGKLAFIGSVREALRFFGVKELKDITRIINPKNEKGEGRADEFVEKFRRLQEKRI